MHSGTQLKNISGWIGSLPAVCQVGQNFKVSAPSHEGVEQKLVNALGLGTEPDSGIEIVGTRFDSDSDRVWPGAWRTAREQKGKSDRRKAIAKMEDSKKPRRPDALTRSICRSCTSIYGDGTQPLSPFVSHSIPRRDL